MKIFIIFFATLVATAVCDEVKFAKWQLKFNKNYKNDDHAQIAKATFLKHDNKIAEHNAKFAKGEVHFQLGHNQFSDWTKEKFDSLLTMDKIEKPPTTRALAFTTVPSGWVPGTLNLTIAAIPVKVQGNCSSCWAFSAAGVIEYNLYKRYSKYYDISEQNFVDCARPLGCSGGWMHEAFNYTLNNGVDYEVVYPYVAKNLTANTCAYKDTSKNDGTGIPKTDARQWYTIPRNELALAYAVSTYGWTSVCVNIDPLRFYQKGIFTADQCTPGVGANHAVIAVGYGTDSLTGMPYWILKNSWDTWWGEQGYFRLERGKNACNISHPYEYYSGVLG